MTRLPLSLKHAMFVPAVFGKALPVFCQKAKNNPPEAGKTDTARGAERQSVRGVLVAGVGRVYPGATAEAVAFGG
jgi:hypothetical protein